LETFDGFLGKFFLKAKGNKTGRSFYRNRPIAPLGSGAP